MRWANVAIIDGVFMKTSSLKFTVPVVNEAISGLRTSGAKRSSAVAVTAPPAEICTIKSVSRRMPSTTFRKTSTSCVGCSWSSRTCRCTMEAPALRHSTAERMISSGEAGRAGLCALVVSAPVMAATITNLSKVITSCLERFLLFLIMRECAPSIARRASRPPLLALFILGDYASAAGFCDNNRLREHISG